MASEAHREPSEARPEVTGVFSHAGLSRAKRRSYEAEDVNRVLVEEDKQLECLEQIKEKDLVIAELQSQLKSLRKTIPTAKSTMKVTNLTVKHLSGGPILPSGPKSFRMMKTAATSTRGGTHGCRSKLPVVSDAKCEQAGDKKAIVSTIHMDAGEDQVRRLTEELAKLQAEYARLRTVLQATTSQQMPDSSRSSPTPFKAPSSVAAGEVHLAEVQIDANGLVSNGEPDCTEKASFRREILRLKEELLATQQKMIVHLEGKSAAVEELHLLKEDYVARERDLLRIIFDRETGESKLKHDVGDLQRQLGEADESNRTLKKRVKESEKEASEMKEFLREEHESLCESFKEAEVRLVKHAYTEAQLRETLKNQEDACNVLTEVTQNSQIRICTLEAELKDTQDGARHLLLKQGDELNACSQVVQQIGQLLDVGSRDYVRPSGLVAAILEAESAGSSAQQDENKADDLLSRLKAIERAVNDTTNKMTTLVTSLETKEAERLLLEANMYTAISRTKELERELTVSTMERERLVQENDRLRTELHESQRMLKESWRNVGDRIDANQREDNLQKELDRERRSLRTVLADNAELETQLNSAVAGDRRLQDEFTLKRQIGSLRQEVLDKHEEIDTMTTKHDRQCKVVMDKLAKAEVEVRRLNAVIDHVLRCLKSVSSVVETDDMLKQLWNDLNGEQSASRDRISLAEPDKK